MKKTASVKAAPAAAASIKPEVASPAKVAAEATAAKVATKAASPVAAKPKAAAVTASVAPKAAPPAKAAPKTTPKAAPKAAPKVAAAKATVAKPAAVKAKAVTVKAPAPAPAPAKAKVEKAVKAGKEKKVALKKPKLVRDSFTFPEAEYALIATLKQRALSAGRDIKKSEVLRAGLASLSGLSDANLLKALDGIAKLKTGRPSK